MQRPTLKAAMILSLAAAACATKPRPKAPLVESKPEVTSAESKPEIMVSQRLTTQVTIPLRTQVTIPLKTSQTQVVRKCIDINEASSLIPVNLLDSEGACSSEQCSEYYYANMKKAVAETGNQTLSFSLRKDNHLNFSLGRGDHFEIYLNSIDPEQADIEVMLYLALLNDGENIKERLNEKIQNNEIRLVGLNNIFVPHGVLFVRAEKIEYGIKFSYHENVFCEGADAAALYKSLYDILEDADRFNPVNTPAQQGP